MGANRNLPVQGELLVPEHLLLGDFIKIQHSGTNKGA